jgi:transposase-like protein
MKQGSEQAFAKWRNLISEQGRSGQSVAAFCRERGLADSHFFYWKKRLRETMTPQFVAVQIANGKQAPARAVLNTTIEVRLSHGRSLVVAPNFDADHLRALLAVLESGS